MSITTQTDYTGKYQITQHATNTSKLQQYIDMYELRYLVDLFGATFYEQYLDGIVDADPLYLKLQDPFVEDVEGGYSGCNCENETLFSIGIKTMLVGFIYWEYYKEDFADSNITGLAKNLPENSQNASVFMANLYSRYNESVGTYRAIQEYIRINRDDYPNFKGKYKKLANWF